MALPKGTINKENWMRWTRTLGTLGAALLVASTSALMGARCGDDAGETMEEIEDEAGDAADEIEDEIDDRT